MINIVSPGDPLSEEEACWLISQADKNGDGSLDFKEFMRVMIGRDEDEKVS